VTLTLRRSIIITSTRTWTLTLTLTLTLTPTPTLIPNLKAKPDDQKAEPCDCNILWGCAGICTQLLHCCWQCGSLSTVADANPVVNPSLWTWPCELLP